MNSRSFFIQLGIVSIFVSVMIYLLNLTPPFQPFQNLSWASCLFFIVFSIGMFLFGQQALKSPNKNTFLQIVIATTFFKMLLCVLFIVAYFKFAEPTSKMYAVPFLLIYVVFTIFETHVMMKLGKTQPLKEKE